MNAVLSTAVGLLGAVVGSFLNVVILRTHDDRTVTGRSACPHCHQTLRWWEMVPVISYVALRGKCQRCGHRLDRQYPIVEALTVLVFVDAWWWLGAEWVLLAAFLIASSMIIIAVYDVRWSAIPDAFTVSLAIGAVGFVFLRPGNWIESLIGAAAGALFFALQYVLSRRAWVGSGDILLAGALGLLLGWRMLGLGLLFAYLSGTVAAVTLLLRKRLSLSSSMPFGPFLLIGAYVAWHWGNMIIDWYFGHAIFS